MTADVITWAMFVLGLAICAIGAYLLLGLGAALVVAGAATMMVALLV